MKLQVFTISQIVRIKDQLHAALAHSFIRAVGLRRLVEIVGHVHVGHVSFLEGIQIITLYFCHYCHNFLTSHCSTCAKFT